jgi:atypical dual specificity phosphatase
MNPPPAFSWIEEPLLAALGYPESEDELHWLRNQGIEVLISLTEEPPPRDAVSEAGLLVYHVPVPDMSAPSQEDLDRVVSAIQKAHQSDMGVGVHCGAGAGRTGVVLACYLVAQGSSSTEAVRKVRRLRPASIETDEQLDAVKTFAQRRKK